MVREVTARPAGSQLAAGTHQPRNKGSWYSEKYAVSRRYFTYITDRWGVQPTVDAFATADDDECPRWCGPGSPNGEDACSQPWSGEFLWLNPHFSVIPQVVRRLVGEQAHGILKVPDWGNRRWHTEVLCPHERICCS